MPEDSLQRQRVFLARESVAGKAAGLILAGIAFFGVLLLYFLMMVRRPSKPGDDFMPGLLGGLSVIGVGLITRGIFLLRLTKSVALVGAGIQLNTFLSQRFIPWTDIDHLEQDKRSPTLGGETVRILRLIGKNGKPLAVIAEAINDFDELTAQIVERTSRTAQHTTFDEAADEQRRILRDTRKIKRLSWGFAVFTLGMGAGLWAGINEELHTRRFATDGVRVDAKIVRHWMVNVTPHVEYTFKDEQGRTFTKDAMMWQGPEWDELEGRKTVPVVYLPDDPSWNRLVDGEDPGAEFGGKFILICAGGIIMFGTMFVVTALGFDLKIENGVHMITRRGRVIKQWG